MTDAAVLDIVNQMLIVSLKLAAPVLICSLVVGVAISVLQAATQVQEMTLTFVPKLLAIAAVLALLGPWMMHTVVNWTSGLFGHLELYAR
jgi:flagellar biosynthetic protein FliQ